MASEPIEYRTLDEYPGYRFGSDGSVWSEWRRRGAVLYTRTGEWKRLKCTVGRKGYLRIKIRVGPRQFRPTLVHRLVLEAFAGPCPEGMEPRHYPDRNPANNAINNLQWGTRSQNFMDKREHGTAWAGERHHNAKITVDDVRDIRKAFASGTTQVSLGKQYGMSQTTISSIVRGKSWAAVK
jgi:hypothetical protein